MEPAKLSASAAKTSGDVSVSRSTRAIKRRGVSGSGRVKTRTEIAFKRATAATTPRLGSRDSSIVFKRDSAVSAISLYLNAGQN